MSNFDMAMSFCKKYKIIAREIFDYFSFSPNFLVLWTTSGDTYTYDCKKDEIVKILKKEDKVIGKITETDWRKEFAMSLRRKLKEKGMSQRALCSITGISPTTINGYTTAKRIPDAYNLTLIANALECSISDLTCFV